MTMITPFKRYKTDKKSSMGKKGTLSKIWGQMGPAVLQ